MKISKLLLLIFIYSPFLYSDLYSSFGGSTKSLDKDAGYESKSSSNTSNDKKDDSGSKNYTSFSSYLNMRTKSPIRPPTIAKTSSLSSSVSSSQTSSKDSNKNGSMFHRDDDIDEGAQKTSSRYSSIGTDAKPMRNSLSSIGERSSLSSIGEKKSSLADGRPPRAPMRIKERSQSAKLPDLKETIGEKSEAKPKTILSLKVSKIL